MQMQSQTPNEKLYHALGCNNLQYLNDAISKGADVNAPSSWTKTKSAPLHVVALRHDPSFAQTLLKAGADPNLRDANGYTPMFLSVFRHKPDVAKILLEATEPKTKTGKTDPRIYALDRMLAEKRADVNIIRNNFGLMHCLRFYPHSEQPAFVRALLEAGLKVDKQTRYGAPLHIAARESANPEVIKILLHAGADANAATKNGFGETPLHMAVESNSNPAVVQALLEGGADVNYTNLNSGQTPLHYVVKTGESPAIMEVLLDAGANVNEEDYLGITALRTAIEGRNVRLAKMLIKRGAEVNKKTGKDSRVPGWVPLHSSIYAPVAITRWLIYADADPNARDNHGKTPLHIAVSLGRDSHTKFLLDNKADIEARDMTGATPLHTAVLAMEFNSIKILLDAGADPGAKNKNGRTPLHWAARCNNNPRVIEALLEKGADVNAKDNNGKTPLFHAEMSNENPAVIDVVRAHASQSTAQGAEDRLAMTNTGM